MGFAGCGVSLATMTAITVDRFLALHYHLQYPNLMTTSRAIYTIITIWCISTLFTFSFIWSPSIYHYFVSAFGITIFLLVNLVCFIEIHRIVRRHQLQIRVQQQAVENSTDTNNHHIRQSTRSAKSIFIYFLVMILCYTPLFFVHIISAINNSKSIILCTFPLLQHSWTRLSIHFYIAGVFPSSERQFLKQQGFYLVEKWRIALQPRNKSLYKI